MGRFGLAAAIWLIFGVMLLGWYGFAMVGIGLVLYLIGFFIKCWWDDRKAEKWREKHEKRKQALLEEMRKKDNTPK